MTEEWRDICTAMAYCSGVAKHASNIAHVSYVHDWKNMVIRCGLPYSYVLMGDLHNTPGPEHYYKT